MSEAAAVNRPPRPTRARVGITGRGIVVLIFVVTAVVGAAAVLAGGHRGHAFGIAFIVTAALGAALVRRKDITTAMIAPPLLYCVLVVLMSFIDTKDQSGGLITRKAVYIADAFIAGAPAIWMRHRSRRRHRLVSTPKRDSTHGLTKRVTHGVTSNVADGVTAPGGSNGVTAMPLHRPPRQPPRRTSLTAPTALTASTNPQPTP